MDPEELERLSDADLDPLSQNYLPEAIATATEILSGMLKQGQYGGQGKRELKGESFQSVQALLRELPPVKYVDPEYVGPEPTALRRERERNREQREANVTVKTIKTIAAIGDVGDDVTSEANVASKCSEGSVKTIEASVNNGYGNDYDGYGGAKGKGGNKDKERVGVGDVRLEGTGGGVLNGLNLNPSDIDRRRVSSSSSSSSSTDKDKDKDADTDVDVDVDLSHAALAENQTETGIGAGVGAGGVDKSTKEALLVLVASLRSEIGSLKAEIAEMKEMRNDKEDKQDNKDNKDNRDNRSDVKDKEDDEEEDGLEGLDIATRDTHKHKLESWEAIANEERERQRGMRNERLVSRQGARSARQRTLNNGRGRGKQTQRVSGHKRITGPGTNTCTSIPSAKSFDLSCASDVLAATGDSDSKLTKCSTTVSTTVSVSKTGNTGKASAGSAGMEHTENENEKSRGKEKEGKASLNDSFFDSDSSDESDGEEEREGEGEREGEDEEASSGWDDEEEEDEESSEEEEEQEKNNDNDNDIDNGDSKGSEQKLPLPLTPSLTSDEIEKRVLRWCRQYKSFPRMLQTVGEVYTGSNALLAKALPTWDIRVVGTVVCVGTGGGQNEPSRADVRKAYFRILRVVHPDKQSAHCQANVRAEAVAVAGALTDRYKLYIALQQQEQEGH